MINIHIKTEMHKTNWITQSRLILITVGLKQLRIIAKQIFFNLENNPFKIQNKQPNGGYAEK